MQHKPYVVPLSADFELGDHASDLDQFLHPASAFEHPSNIIDDPDLTLNEKRAILASWASDACAIEAAPALGRSPRAKQPVRFDDVMEALRDLDKRARDHQSARYKRILRAGRLFPRRGPSDRGQGQAIN